MTADQIGHARAAIVAKVAYWDALRQFEVMTSDDSDEWSDSINDKACEAIENLAACCGDTAEDDECVTDADIERAFEFMFREKA